jgi:glutaryl-CoA dehydrogenase
MSMSAARPTPFLSADFYNILTNSLSAEGARIRLAVQSFVRSYVAPIISDHIEKAEFPHSVLPHLAKLNVCGLDMTGYNCAGLTAIINGIIAIELSKVSMGLATFFCILQPISMSAIYKCGSEEQKAKYLPSLAKLEKIACFCLTEPEAGSDAVNLKTNCRRDLEDKDYWLINGEKRWIGNGTFADLYIVWCSVTDAKSSGVIHGFIIEKSTPGLRAEKINNKTALREVQNAHIYLSNVRVHESQRLPLCTSFNTGPARSLFLTRIIASYIALGGTMAAYEQALQYTLQRKQFNSPLAGFQLTQDKLVRSVSTIQAMWLMSNHIANIYDNHRDQLSYGMVGSLKAFNTHNSRLILSDLRSIIGGNGILNEEKLFIGRIHADLEAIHTYEGSHEVNTLIAAREITGLSAFKTTKLHSKL